MKFLVLGFPATGKTTAFRELKGNGFEVVDLDYKATQGMKTNTTRELKSAQTRLVSEMYKSGCDVILTFGPYVYIDEVDAGEELVVISVTHESKEQCLKRVLFRGGEGALSFHNQLEEFYDQWVAGWRKMTSAKYNIQHHIVKKDEYLFDKMIELYPFLGEKKGKA